MAVWCKEKAEYILPNPDAKPGAKHGHWSHREANKSLEDAEAAAETALAWAWGFDRKITIEEFKQNIVSFSFGTPEGDTSTPDLDISYLSVPVRDGTKLELKIYRRKTSSPQKEACLVLRFHGGGWVVGCHETEEPENRILGALPDVVVASLNYRMAPEHPFPGPVNDCFDVLRWCKSHGKEALNIDPERIILVGCSAGANLAAAVSIMARDEGVTGIVAQHLAIPVTCHPKLFSKIPNGENLELLSYVQNHDAALVDAHRMEVFWDLYTGLDPGVDFRHSPLLCEDLKGLPPTLLQVAGRDPLRDEGIAFAEALGKAGVPMELIVYRGLPHGFAGFDIPEAQEYYKQVAGFVTKHGSRGK